MDEVFLSPRHPYTEGLLASMPSRSRRGERLSVIKGSVPNPFNMPPGCNFAPRCPNRFEPCNVYDPRLGDPATDSGGTVACWLWMDPPAETPAASVTDVAPPGAHAAPGAPAHGASEGPQA